MIVIFSSTPNSLQDVVHSLCERLVDDFLDVDVRRDHILRDALREGRKKKFMPNKRLKVWVITLYIVSGVIPCY